MRRIYITPNWAQFAETLGELSPWSQFAQTCGELAGASQNLQILSADLSNPESFSAATEGCIGVFHVATPMDFELQEPEEVVTKRTIDGALGILKACLNNSNIVKRVIYTSSSSAVLYHNSCGKDDSSEEVVLNEDFWSDVDYLRTSKVDGWSYSVSKTLTEKAVLEFGEQNGLDVVTLVPTFVLGPFVGLSFLVQFMLHCPWHLIGVHMLNSYQEEGNFSLMFLLSWSIMRYINSRILRFSRTHPWVGMRDGQQARRMHKPASLHAAFQALYFSNVPSRVGTYGATGGAKRESCELIWEVNRTKSVQDRYGYDLIPYGFGKPNIWNSSPPSLERRRVGLFEFVGDDVPRFGCLSLCFSMVVMSFFRSFSNL
ncbi:hypothetical protein PIB30_035678 [Stylosanthes scabra]|uniref:3-beta hydroxysteroid dehydrogenase/isomerase domain-containing protein n=1 Tax=Stylosanthes scabra TaxID=79078 RepID=A0ABU6TDG0_9FABA|nr:hypothetical protein [Stylosanthes scabra]